jgi:hypothetical protein
VLATSTATLFYRSMSSIRVLSLSVSRCLPSSLRPLPSSVLTHPKRDHVLSHVLLLAASTDCCRCWLIRCAIALLSGFDVKIAILVN